jgi:hypothetical protein
MNHQLTREQKEIIQLFTGKMVVNNETNNDTNCDDRDSFITKNDLQVFKNSLRFTDGMYIQNFDFYRLNIKLDMTHDEFQNDTSTGKIIDVYYG